MKRTFSGLLVLALVLSMFTGMVAAAENVIVPPEFSRDVIKSSGPNGEPAASTTVLSLSEEELQKVKDGNFKVAISFHTLANEFNSSVNAAIKQTCEELGIEIVGVTDANFKVEQQVADVESLLALKPDVLLAMPIDPISTEQVFRDAIASGVKIVFMENIAANMTAGNDYVTCVAADNYGNGVAAADIMAQALGNKGKVGIVFHDANFFVTKQRSDGFRDTIVSKYPDIEIVEEAGFTDQNKTTEIGDAMLAKHPDINGIFTAWDIPAEGIMASAESIGKQDLIITTIDLGQNAARIIAEDGMIKGLGAQRPYEQGVACAQSVAYALLNKEIPPFITSPALPVVKVNLLEAYQEAYHTDPPAELVEIVEKNK